jgi:hypothetical protein
MRTGLVAFLFFGIDVCKRSTEGTTYKNPIFPGGLRNFCSHSINPLKNSLFSQAHESYQFFQPLGKISLGPPAKTFFSSDNP